MKRIFKNRVPLFAMHSVLTAPGTAVPGYQAGRQTPNPAFLGEALRRPNLLPQAPFVLQRKLASEQFEALIALRHGSLPNTWTLATAFGFNLPTAACTVVKQASLFFWRRLKRSPV